MRKISKAVLPAGIGAILAASTLLAAPAAVAQGEGSTVLTFEGGLVGIQPFLYFTPSQLQGDLCDAPNNCKPVYYAAIPLGQLFNNWGADALEKAVDSTAGPVTLFGHSQGGQVIYTALRRWAADPGSAPDPSRVSWVSIGNPENAFGGRAAKPLPADSPYQGIEVIRQYDGWADAPSDKTNLLAMLNAAVGRSTTHVFGYFDVDLNDPNNIRYTPDNPGGGPGNITYVFVPTPVMPLVARFGPLAPVLDKMLRPIVEAGYNRPISLNGSNPSAAVTVSPVTPVSRTVAARTAAAPSAAALTAAPTAVKPAAAQGAKRARATAAVKPSTTVKPAAAVRSARS